MKASITVWALLVGACGGQEAPLPGGAGGAAPLCDGETSITTVAMLSVGRYAPAVARLEDGRVLVAGGYDFTLGAQASAEIFDPTTGALTATGSLPRARNFAAAARVPDGRVLVAGGFDPVTGSVPDADLYDPESGAFTATGHMIIGREAHTATVLPDGRVLVAGGLQAAGFVFHDTIERYDPASGAFALLAGTLAAPRAFHAATVLADESAVLLVGGDSGAGELASAERVLATTGAPVATAGGRSQPGKAVAAALLDDERVLVTGGANGDGTLANADLFDPASDGFGAASPMTTERMAHTLTRLPDGRVLAIGGWSDSTSPSASSDAVELFDPASGSWELADARLAQSRLDHAAILLDGCRVLVVGGQHVPAGDGPSAPREVELVTIGAR